MNGTAGIQHSEFLFCVVCRTQNSSFTHDCMTKGETMDEDVRPKTNDEQSCNGASASLEGL